MIILLSFETQHDAKESCKTVVAPCDDEKWDEHHREHSMRASKEREEVETFGVTFDITTKDEISTTVCTARHRPRRSVQLWSVSTHLYRESERERERESERVSKHTYSQRYEIY